MIKGQSPTGIHKATKLDICSLDHYQHFLKITSFQSIHNFSTYFVHSQTDNVTSTVMWRFFELRQLLFHLSKVNDLGTKHQNILLLIIAVKLASPTGLDFLCKRGYFSTDTHFLSKLFFNFIFCIQNVFIPVVIFTVSRLFSIFRAMTIKTVLKMANLTSFPNCNIGYKPTVFRFK